MFKSNKRYFYPITTLHSYWAQKQRLEMESELIECRESLRQEKQKNRVLEQQVLSLNQDIHNVEISYQAQIQELRLQIRDLRDYKESVVEFLERWAPKRDKLLKMQRSAEARIAEADRRERDLDTRESLLHQIEILNRELVETERLKLCLEDEKTVLQKTLGQEKKIALQSKTSLSKLREVFFNTIERVRYLTHDKRASAPLSPEDSIALAALQNEAELSDFLQRAPQLNPTHTLGTSYSFTPQTHQESYRPTNTPLLREHNNDIPFDDLESYASKMATQVLDQLEHKLSKDATEREVLSIKLDSATKKMSELQVRLEGSAEAIQDQEYAIKKNFVMQEVLEEQYKASENKRLELLQKLRESERDRKQTLRTLSTLFTSIHRELGRTLGYVPSSISQVERDILKNLSKKNVVRREKEFDSEESEEWENGNEQNSRMSVSRSSHNCKLSERLQSIRLKEQ